MEITELIQNLLSQLKSVDIAESEFKRMINDDEVLKAQFKEWCDEMGYSTRTAFKFYSQEYLESHDSIFDTLSDYNE